MYNFSYIFSKYSVYIKRNVWTLAWRTLGSTTTLLLSLKCLSTSCSSNPIKVVIQPQLSWPICSLNRRGSRKVERVFDFGEMGSWSKDAVGETLILYLLWCLWTCLWFNDLCPWHGHWSQQQNSAVLNPINRLSFLYWQIIQCMHFRASTVQLSEIFMSSEDL